MHNQDSRVNDEPVVDLEKGELHDNEQVLSLNDGLSEEARRDEAVVSNEGTCGLGQMISKYPEDMTTGDNEPCASLMPTMAVSESGMEPRNDSGLSSAVKDTSALDYLAARNEETLAMPSIVVSGGRTCIFDGVSSNNDESSVVLSPQKAQLSRNSSSHEQCRFTPSYTADGLSWSRKEGNELTVRKLYSFLTQLQGPEHQEHH